MIDGDADLGDLRHNASALAAAFRDSDDVQDSQDKEEEDEEEWMARGRGGTGEGGGEVSGALARWARVAPEQHAPPSAAIGGWYSGEDGAGGAGVGRRRRRRRGSLAVPPSVARRLLVRMKRGPEARDGGAGAASAHAQGAISGAMHKRALAYNAAGGVAGSAGQLASMGMERAAFGARDGRDAHGHDEAEELWQQGQRNAAEEEKEEEEEEMLEAAAERARWLVEKEAAAARADSKRAWGDMRHGEKGVEHADYSGQVAPGWLGTLHT